MNPLSRLLLAAVCLLTACDTPPPTAPSLNLPSASRASSLVVRSDSGPSLNLDANAENFGDYRVCGSGVTKRLEVLNESTTEERRIQLIKADPPFEVTGYEDASGQSLSTYPTKLNPREKFKVVVTFNPRKSGRSSGYLFVYNSDPINGLLKAELTGNGTGPYLDVSPTSLALSLTPAASSNPDGGTPADPDAGTASDGGTAQSPPASHQGTVRLRNTGTAALTLSASLLSGLHFAVAPGYKTALPVGDYTDLVVTYAPTSPSVLTATDVLNIQNSGDCGTAEVSLTGFRSSGPVLVLDRNSLAFAEQEVGSSSAIQSVTVSNPGGAPLTVSTVLSPSATAFAVSPSGDFTLQPRESRVLSVRFIPTAAGAGQTATLQLNGNGTPSSESVSLRGDATQGLLKHSPSTLTFPLHRAGSSAGTQTLTLENSGTQAVEFTVSVQAASAPGAFEVNTPSIKVEPGQSGIKTLAVSLNIPSGTPAGALLGSLVLTSSSAGVPSRTIPLVATVARVRVEPVETQLDFGSHEVNNLPVSKQLHLKNTGELPVTVNAVNWGPADPFAVEGLPKTIAAGAIEAVTVKFQPTRRMLWERTLQLTSDADTAIPSVKLTGTATAAVLSIIEGATLSFGDQVIGSASTAKLVTLKNTGDAPLTFATPLALDDSTHFRMNASSPPSLAAGASFSFGVVFDPKVLGPLKTKIVLPDNQLIQMTGTSIGLSASFSPKPTLDFGPWPVNGNALNKQVLVRNAANATESLEITSASIQKGAGIFTLKTFSTTCAPGGIIQIPIDFKPSVMGQQYTDALVINYRGTTSKIPQTETIDLSGSGSGSLLEITGDWSPQKGISFGQVERNTEKRLTIELKNAGTAPLKVDTISFGASNPALTLAPITDDLNVPLPVGDNSKSIRVTVVFVPTEQSAISATLKIQSNAVGANAPGGTTTIDISGQGAVPKAIFPIGSDNNIKPIDFGSAAIGEDTTRTLKVSNAGSAPLRLDKPFLSSRFDIALPANMTWPAEIPATKSIDLTVIFKPDSTKDIAETCSFVSNDPSGPFKLSLTGKGTRPALDVAPQSVSFGDVALSSTIATQPVVLSNTSQAKLTITSIATANPFCFYLTSTATECITQSPAGYLVTIDKGQSNALTLRVGIKPDSTGEKPGVLTLLTNQREVSGSEDPFSKNVPLTARIYKGLTITPRKVSFGTPLPEGGPDSLTETITLSTDQTAGAVINSVALQDEQGGPSPDFQWAGTLPCTVKPNAPPKDNNCYLTVTFKPKQGVSPSRKAKVLISLTPSNSPTVQEEVILEGTVTNPVLSITRDGAKLGSDIDFRQVLTNTSSQPIKLKLENTTSGTAVPLKVDVKLTGLHVSHFVLSRTGTLDPLFPKQSTDLSVSFTPGASVQGYEAVLSVATNDPNYKNFDVRLHGEGTAAVLALSTTELNFGTLIAGSQVGRDTVTVLNTSGRKIVITGVKLTNNDDSHFETTAWTQDTYALEAGQTLSLPVTFSPLPDTSSSGELRITTQEPSAPVLKVQLRGKGRSSVFKDFKRQVDFKTHRLSEPPPVERVSLLNDGDKTIYVTGELQESQAGDFSFDFDALSCRRNALVIEIRTGETCDLTLSHIAQRVTLSKAVLQLTVNTQVSGDLATKARINLSGEKVSSLMAVDPMKVDFGWVDIDQQLEPRLITVTNQSSVATRVLIPEVTNPEAFTVEALEPGRELPPAASTQLRVTFHPQGGGEATGELRLRLQGEQVTDVAIVLSGQVRAIGGEGGAHACGASPEGAILSGGWLLMLLGLSGRRRARGTSP